MNLSILEAYLDRLASSINQPQLSTTATNLNMGQSIENKTEGVPIIKRSDEKLLNFRDPLDIYYRSLEKVAYSKLIIKKKKNPMYFCFKCKQLMRSYHAICNHINKHRNVKPYICNIDLCNRKYTTSRSLKEHFKRNHGNRSYKSVAIAYKCPVCLKNFTDYLMLLTHLSTETRDSLENNAKRSQSESSNKLN